MLFFGANIGENIDISANGGRVLFSRDIANVTMDLDDVEQIDYRALGGADNVVVGDLTGTDVTAVTPDLRGPNGDDVALLAAGDDTFVWNPGDDNDTLEGQDGSDRMAFNGANIAEHIDISATGGRVRFTRDIAGVT